ncbi:ESF1 homolog isoform X2 [Nematostella vectensis]|uniref:ESF1 homolog isoform X2 n=1 Tax=Nematostella vectensis TaxID=45351 RepID=UPI00207767E7|nr:ESF1 homolog isoform X2 [Nematostella vectensis]
MSENRFSRVSRDPRFKKIPRKQRKVKIDSRFERMFTDKSFTTKYFVDKRGAVVGKTSKEDLHQFYDLSDDDQEGRISDGSEEGDNNKSRSQKTLKEKKAVKEKKRKNVEHIQTQDNDTQHQDFNDKNTKKRTQKSNNGAQLKRKKKENKSSTPKDIDSDDNQSENDDGNKDHVESDASCDNKEPDFARGEGMFETSSSEDDNDYDESHGELTLNREDEDDTDEESIFNAKQDEQEHDWGELDKGAKLRSDATRRLAVCSLDWDRLAAQDLFVLFSSVGAKGIIKSVKIFPSEFGLERMKAEEALGPTELCASNQAKEDQEDVSNQEGSEFSREKLRQYQLNKLKYYYAVVECDSAETANFIYEECDGVEFEMTGNLLDLRFIPDDMEFEHEPTSSATEMPDLNTYKPPEFETTALHQSNVKLTWDETDANRLKTTMKKFSKGDIEAMDFKAYLASSSDDEEAASDAGSEDEEANITKYKQLVQDLDSKDADDGIDEEMEITWEPGLKESAEELVTRKLAEKKKKKLTPWEAYLNKKKEKKKERKKQKNKTEHNDEGEADDDIPEDVDMSDPFFSQDFGPEFPSGEKDSQQNGKTAKKKRTKTSGPETGQDKKNKDELELLLMEEGDDRQHFSLKSIMNKEKQSKKKKRRARGKTDDADDKDTFKVDVEDPRFAALYSSHHYAIDPSDQQFKKTRAVEAILQERHRRRDRGPSTENRKQPKNDKETTRRADVMPPQDPSLSLLVKSVKLKTEEFQHRKKKKIL